MKDTTSDNAKPSSSVKMSEKAPRRSLLNHLVNEILPFRN